MPCYESGKEPPGYVKSTGDGGSADLAGCETSCIEGACCVGNNNCFMTTAEGCQAAGGHFYGPGTDCSTNLCRGFACCLPSGVCTATHQMRCADLGGTFHDGKQCWQVSCLPGNPLP